MCCGETVITLSNTSGVGPQGPRGPQGPPGESISALGVEANYTSLISHHPTPNHLDAYIVQDTSHFWIYDPTSSAANGDGWVDMGSLQGPQGLQGIQGPAGTNGINGTNGTNGIDGKTILSGTNTPGSGVGNNGDYYINTTTWQIYGPKTSGAWGSGISLIGPAGSAGTNGVNGNTILNGIIDPTSGIGNNGDFYINTNTFSIFGPKTSGVWGTGTRLITAAPVISVAGKIGTVTLDQNDITSVLNKRTVTDAYLAALAGTYGTPGPSNKYVTTTDPRLTALSGIPINVIQNYEDGINSSGNNTGVTLGTLGYTSGTAATQFPLTAGLWGSISTSTTYDSCVFQEAIATLGYQKNTYLTSLQNRLYHLNHQIIIPTLKYDVASTDRTNSQQYIVDLVGCRIRDIRTSTFLPLFYKSPSDQTSANNHDVEFSWTFKNFDVIAEVTGFGFPYGTSSCFRIGSGKRWKFENVTLRNYDTAFIGSMLLNTHFLNCEFINCTTSGFKNQVGWWSGATAGQNCSQLTFERCRFQDAGLKFLDLTNADSCHVLDCQVEGSAGDYGIYWDNTATSVIKGLTITNLRSEHQSHFAKAIVGINSNDGFYVALKGGWHQAGTSGTILIEAGGTGETRIDIENWYNSGGTSAWKFRNIGSNTCWEIHKTMLQGQPTTEANLISGIAPYDNIWDLTSGGTIPTSNRVNFTPRLPK